MLALHFALIALFTVAWPLYSWRVSYPRLIRDIDRGVPGVRLRAYRTTILEQWLLAACAVVLWRLAGRAPAALGLGLPHPVRFAIGLALAIAAIVFLTLQRRMVAAKPAVLERVRVRLGEAARFVPHTNTEHTTWKVLSVTAGICEEVLFRGYLVAFLAPWTTTLGAFAISIVLFGAAHIYLGRTGAIRAAVVGALLAGIYAATGSLWVSMILHAAVDLHSGALGFAATKVPPAPNVEQAA